MKTMIQTVVLCLAAATLLGCEGVPADDATAQAPPPAAAAAPTIPATLFAATAPADAIPLIDAKANAGPGDRVVFEARVGGRREAFVENRAVFFVADSSLLSCDQLHGDTCKTPWDYCCEPRDNLLKHMATVQVVDGDGQPLKTSLSDAHGLAPLRTVLVTGTVLEVDEAGTFVVNAESIHVKEG
ncbi:MAG: hypothetical protein ACYTJ0_11730 [Planctomycetota bacterium]|jgi:hypothetical protein